MKEINNKLNKKDHKFAILAANCPAHLHIENLEHVKLVFLFPKNILR